MSRTHEIVRRCLAVASVLVCSCAATEASTQAPPSLRINVATQAYGSGWNFAFVVRVDDDADRPIAQNGSVVIDPIAPGEHTVTLVTHYPNTLFGCRVTAGLAQMPTVTVTVARTGVSEVSYSVVCIP